MKKILFIILIFCLQILSAQSDLQWTPSFEKAKEIAKKNDKPILIFFTESGCDICKMLDKDFLSSDKFKKTANQLVLYKANFPRRTNVISIKKREINLQLDKTYSKTRKKRSFPTIIYIDASGKELGFIESYNYIHDTSRHFGLLQTILKKYTK